MGLAGAGRVGSAIAVAVAVGIDGRHLASARHATAAIGPRLEACGTGNPRAPQASHPALRAASTTSETLIARSTCSVVCPSSKLWWSIVSIVRRSWWPSP